MGLFNPSRSHASGIVDIYWDAGGNPTTLKLVEANYGPGGAAYQRAGFFWTGPLGSNGFCGPPDLGI